MSFTIWGNENMPVRDIKTRSSKSRKIAFYSKGLVHAFGQKLPIFPNFYFREHRLEKCVLRYSRTKQWLSKA